MSRRLLEEDHLFDVISNVIVAKDGEFLQVVTKDGKFVDHTTQSYL